MVGFKSIWLLLTLLLFGACVPQTKQTECASNEAFNAALRTCVPVVNGPSSFIDIDSFSPTSALTKYEGDSNPVTFTVSIENPYAQTYSVEWEHIFNGSPDPISPDTATSWSVAPSFFSGQIGIHIIAVKIKDTQNNIVDSHSFELKINDSPKPVISSSTVLPALYHSSFTPSSGIQSFQFTVKNNNATMAGQGYKTEWKLYKNNNLLVTSNETDTFPTISPAGSLTSTGFNYPVFLFNPATLGVGAYEIKARITNTLAEVVDEQQWTATVAHPALSLVTNRDIYSAGGTPAFTAITTAYNGVAHNPASIYNFVPVGGVAQGDYCVTVQSGEGTYVGDGEYVRVDFYLDGATLIYSGMTSTVDNKICLTDGGAAARNALMFTNPAPTGDFSHTLTATLYDEGSDQPYTSGNVNTGLGSYPITWNFNVKPQNTAPTVAFGTMTTVTCPTTSGNTKSGCGVESDTNFKVKIALTSNTTGDDFYDLPANEANFDYSIRLYENGIQIQSCTKAGYSVADANLVAAADVNGADGYECEFRINSFNGSGPFNTITRSYQIQADISDNGSPISPTPATSSTLNWNFAVGGVTEKNSAPSVAAWSVSNAVEGVVNGLTFSANITDAERDNHTYAIKYCIDVACTSEGTLTSGAITRTTNTNPYAFSLNYTLPEDFLQIFAAQGCGLLRSTTCPIKFKLTVNDVPYTATPTSFTTGVFTSTITNTNPIPVLNTAFSLPAPSTFSALTTFAFVGHPLSITNAPTSILVDTSAVLSEKTYRYQWYSKNNTSVTTYAAIDGATGPNLVWTPSLMKDLPTDNPISIMLCVDDQPVAAVPTPNLVNSVCSNASPWIVTVRNNVATVHDLAAPSELASIAGELGNETAIWYETPSTFAPTSVTSSAAYIAMIGNDQYIHVKKVLVRDNGQIDTINSTHIVSLYPVPSGVVDTVKDLSITGNGNDIYIAYLASRTGSPASFYPQVRRINTNLGSTKLAPNNHAGRIGFDYDGLGIVNGCTPVGDCLPVSATSGLTTFQFATSGGPTGGAITLQTKYPDVLGNVIINFGVANGPTTICESCTNAAKATQLANIINTSTNPLLAGYSATSGGTDTVTIHGSEANDYFDASPPHALSRIAGQLGDIYINNSDGRWYVPFINKTIGGSFTDKLSAFSGPPAVNITTGGVTLLEPTTLASGPGEMDKAIAFDSFYDGTDLWIGIVSMTGSVGKIYRADPTTYDHIAASEAKTIMSSTALADIQIGANSSMAYVVATTSLGNILKLGVYDSNLTNVTLSEFTIDDAAHADAATQNIFNSTEVASFKILPYGTQARLLATSGSGVNYNLYLASLKSVASVWTLSCGDCDQISELEETVSPFVQIGAAPIRFEAGAAYKLSTDDPTHPAQGEKDVMFISYGNEVVTGTEPAIGVLNVEAEAINSTNPHSATLDTGLFRSPLIKN